MVSWSSLSGPQARPPSRMITGMLASMMVSLGTCRLVMPRLEFTMYSSGRWL